MDILTLIESKIIEVLESIDGTEQTYNSRFPYKYTYKTITGPINVRDEVLDYLEKDGENLVCYTIDQDDTERSVFEVGANIQRYETSYTIIATVENDDIEINAKNAINIKLNEILADIKYAFGKNHTLKNTCYRFSLISSNKEFTKNNDIINSGKIIMNFLLDYGSHISNPDIPINNTQIN